MPAHDYQAHKDRTNARQKAASVESRDIGPLLTQTKPKDIDRRLRAEASLLEHIRAYHSATFYLPFSPDHLRLIRALEAAILEGEARAIACMRGFGKTVLIQAAAFWGATAGHVHFPVVVGASAPHAERIIANLTTWLSNKTFAADYPEICLPIQRLKTKQTRLLYYGEPLRYKFTSNQIILPNVPGSAAAGAIIHGVGIDGSIRGINYTDPDTQQTHRPDTLLLDDIQTDSSARSETEVEHRLDTIRQGLEGLSAGQNAIAALAAVTVIRANDAADQLLNRDENPDWRGVRYSQINRIPTQLDEDATEDQKAQADLWRQYWDIRADRLREDPEDTDENAAPAVRKPPEEFAETKFYVEHRAVMDADLACRWEYRFVPKWGEISAIQHIMNAIQRRGLKAVLAEYNNAPQDEQAADLTLDAKTIRHRLSRVPRRRVPAAATNLVGFVDIHGDVLYWMVAALDPLGTSFVVDYGTTPEQARRLFKKDDATRTLSTDRHYRQQPTLEARIVAALNDTLDRIVDTGWKREDGLTLSVDRVLVDANWGEQTKTIYNAIRLSPHSSRVRPSHGKGVTASMAPLSKWKGAHERKGPEWSIGPNRGLFRVMFDANFWKTYAAQRLLTATGAPGSALLYGHSPEEHINLSGHLTAEVAIEKQSRERRCMEWEPRKPERDNHWWDCFVGCLVAGSTLNINVDPNAMPKTTGPTPEDVDPETELPLTQTTPESSHTANLERSHPSPSRPRHAAPVTTPKRQRVTDPAKLRAMARANKSNNGWEPDQ